MERKEDGRKGVRSGDLDQGWTQSQISGSSPRIARNGGRWARSPLGPAPSREQKQDKAPGRQDLLFSAHRRVRDMPGV